MNNSNEIHLLAAYEAANAEVENLLKLQNEAMQKRSELVKRIGETYGTDKKLEYKGKILGTIILRKGTYFFRGLSKQEILKVE